MPIIDVVDRTKEISKVVSLREGGKLRNIVQTNIDQALDTCGTQTLKESLCRGLGEADREQFHVIALAMRSFWRHRS